MTLAPKEFLMWVGPVTVVLTLLWESPAVSLQTQPRFRNEAA